MGLYVWGTGCTAGDLVQQGLNPEKITAFIDNYPIENQFLGKPVLRPDQLPIDQIQLILVTSRHCETIRSQCLALGLKPESLFFLKNNYLLQDLNEGCTIAKELLGSELLSRLSHSCHMIRRPAGCPDLLPPSRETQSDYVRTKTLELLTLSLSQVPGAAAELGVYKGAFARLINELLPDRKLYLFDSFEGFQPEEAKKELAANTCTEGMIASHKNTAADLVVSSMPHPEQILVYEGYFPQSLNNLEETFALVSLDADFEVTTYDGLCYFWPRLSSGGYLMLHDYNSPNLTGVRQAVKRYECDHQIHLPGVPVCDIGGTLVLCKP